MYSRQIPCLTVQCSCFRSPSLCTTLSPTGSLTTASQTVGYIQAGSSHIGTRYWVWMRHTRRTSRRPALTSDGLWFRGARRRDHQRLGAALFSSIGCTSCWSNSLGIWILSTNGQFHCCPRCLQKANKLAGCWFRGEIKFTGKLVDLYFHYYSWKLEPSMVERRVRGKFFPCQDLSGQARMVAVPF